MKKLLIKPGCISCGSCEQIAQNVFEVTDIAHVKDGVTLKEYEKEIREAARNCPVDVIKVEEECYEIS